MKRVSGVLLIAAFACFFFSCSDDSGSGSQDLSQGQDVQGQDDQRSEPDLTPVPPECTAQYLTACQDGAVYWLDGCGNRGEWIRTCECGCAAGELDCLVCNCVPDCTGKACGDDGCGGQCQPGCGNGFSCDLGTGQCVGCAPQCEGRVCGDDMCGGTCQPGCAQGQLCDEGVGQCLTPCYPDCTGKQCGDNGCGGSCGTCADGGACGADFQCPTTGCTCSGKQCGDDGCGNSCGSCGSGTTCNTSTNQCESSCQGDCQGKQCGDDGCGNPCGTCPNGQTCDAQFQCVSACVPNCEGKVCGSNGCGGTCAPGCTSGQTCNAAGTVCEQTCGNGVADQGEACDPSVPGWPSGGASCSQVMMNGDGKVDCDPYDCKPIVDGCICEPLFGANCGVIANEEGCLWCTAIALCADQFKDCKLDSSCTDWLGCVSQCDSAYCIDNCTDAIQPTTNATAELRRCFACQCKSSCGFEAVNCL